MPTPISVLLIDDPNNDPQVMLDFLRQVGLDPTCERAQSIAEMRLFLSRQLFDLLLLTDNLPALDPLETLAALALIPAHPPVIVITKGCDVQSAVRFLKNGAQDLLERSELPRLGQAAVQAIIEARRRAEERTNLANLQFTSQSLEKHTRLMEILLASISHELRPPLIVLLGLVESLRSGVYGSLDEKQLGPLNLIEDNGQQLLALIADMLDLANIESGQSVPQAQDCSLSEICQASLRQVRALYKKRLDIRFSTHPPGIHIQADQRRLRQMLSMLLSNAARYTPEGGSLGIQVSGDQPGARVTISIWNRGASDRDVARQYDRDGLGLSLARRLAQLHNGSLEVESTPGQGGRCTITLPWEVPDEPIFDAPPPTPEVARASDAPAAAEASPE